ncbi:hypothetical protein KL949_004325 [Ogataea haglerorum]|nr:hypothetical protein KL951_001003 [Ogataea haglerorum]KAG7710891.1 hypothetical protein KL950_000857 [Ogataea haglerorum]KAG7714641.1 hypothetical protein KL913_004411 [Ogataea haglerorum]KAG7715411.1 hypothetical protein KL949_004325 [Ogataea haglerorum]KAG7741157.1 hypothetical protein KL923_001798 [Ogataea haglerorum]
MADSASKSRPRSVAIGRDQSRTLPKTLAAPHGGWLPQIYGFGLLAPASPTELDRKARISSACRPNSKITAIDSHGTKT